MTVNSLSEMTIVINTIVAIAPLKNKHNNQNKSFLKKILLNKRQSGTSMKFKK